MMTTKKDFYIYTYRFHDLEVDCNQNEEYNENGYYQKKSKKKNSMDILGYGIDIHHEPILLRIVKDSFRPWLVLEVLDSTSEYSIRRDMEKIDEKFGMNQKSEIFMEHYPVKSKLYFYNTKPLRCYRLFFASNKLRKLFAWKFREKFKSRFGNRYKLNENGASPLLQFLSEFNLGSCGWVSVSNFDEIPLKGRITRHSMEYQGLPKDIEQLENQEKYPVPIFKSLSFDIEAYSTIYSRVPMACNISDVVFQIGMTLTDSTGEKNLLFSLSKSKSIRFRKLTSSEVRCFSTERQMLQAFCDLLCEYNPILIMGYNLFSFDIPFLHEKCEMYHIDMTTCGMLKDYVSNYTEIKWSSTAFRCQEFHFYDFDGRITVDMLPIIRKNYKFSNYKLKTVSYNILKNHETKDPLDHIGIFECFRLGFLEGNDTNLLMKCGKYCIQDARLVRKLFEDTLTLFSLLEMAKLCNTQLMDLYTKGEQLKVFSQLYKKCFLEKRMVDSLDNIDPKYQHLFEFENYTGAYVFPPIPGKYSWVLPFDFTSLYPTTIIANNICYSTFVVEKDIGDSECHVISWKDEQKEYKFRFKKKPMGVIPALLDTLLGQRNITKKQLKHSSGFVRDILDKRQLAYKISANSAYGMMGVRHGFLPFLPGAMCTTAMGRQYISKAAEYVSKTFHGKIVYGDSIHKNTTIYIKYSNNEIKLYPIETYFQFYKKNILPYEQFKADMIGLSHKQQIIFNSDKYKIMSFNGWTNIKRLIRHYTSKHLFKVFTTCGSIIVTEDHSLLLETRCEIKPTQLVPNEHILANIDNTQEISENLIYQKEEWKSVFSQKNGYIFFGEEVEEKYISYIYYTYLQHFPNAIFDFFLSKDGTSLVYGIDLHNHAKKEKGLVLKIEDLGRSTDFVYDVETCDGTFHAGISLLVKNTDSIYVNFNDIEKNPKIVWKHANMIEKHLIEKKIFPEPMKLLFESKIYKEFLILTKKRYMAYTCTENGIIDDKLTIRGVILTRRDNSEWSRRIYEKVVRLIMENTSLEFIVEIINQEILNLFQWVHHDSSQESFNINDFVITKSLNENYKVRALPNDIKKIYQRLDELEIDYTETDLLEKDIMNYNIDISKGHSKHNIIQHYIEKSYPAHVQLAHKMEKRGQPVATGSRLEYVICKMSNDPNEKLFQKLEDPSYFKAFCDIYRLDRLYYFKNIVLVLDQLLNTTFLKACPRNCNCHIKIKTKLQIISKKNKKNFFEKRKKLSKNNIKIGPITSIVRSICSCNSSCPCKNNIYNPVDTIYNYHAQHLKIMNELQEHNKTQILYIS